VWGGGGITPTLVASTRLLNNSLWNTPSVHTIVPLDNTQAAAPVFASGACFGFFIGDELYAQGVEPSELTLAAAAVRSSFPDAITWV
jgi:hypothetical protein